MKPPRSILDPAFRYVPSANTDLRRTFERVRLEMQKADEREIVQPLNVRPLITHKVKT